MTTLYITSAERAAGKTLVCANIGSHLQSAGKKVGYFKFLASDTKDGDAAFMKQALGQDAATESISDGNTLVSRVKAAGKDVVIVEGAADDKSAAEKAKALNAKVIVVEAYSDKASPSNYSGFVDNLAGIIVNRVPKSRIKSAKESASARFGAKVLGILPEDRLLFTMTVADLATCVQGKIVNSANRAGELVESFMLGALLTDPGTEYFGRKANKAVLLRGDRPDMQLAALNTPCRCMILGGTTTLPQYTVMNKAERKKVPIIITKSDVATMIKTIEEALSSNRFSQEKKLARLAEIMPPSPELQTLYKILAG